MKDLRIANWLLSLPEEFQLSEKEVDNHFEREDGRIEVFLKSIKTVSPSTSKENAENIQATHASSFLELSGYRWNISKKAVAQGEQFISSLELCDPDKKYFVVSIVVSQLDEAIQVTVHDYLYDDGRDEARAICNRIAKSIKRVV
ncbi:hypothetical protein GIW26_01220 [Pseudomonas syringae]|uniref:hypothetical protein n=1 Tax=Pseudomonas syringae TaxID=317 RepID=UPI001F39111E|nr:hypothetical protein [Pseudomonas syringae]MCF8982235.1 hypothetical protein [Pseudomonas syringae]